MKPLVLRAFAGLFLLAAAPAGAAEWLPRNTLVPRAWADPTEPRVGLTYAPDPQTIDAGVGLPLPVVAFDLGSGRGQVVVEGGVLMRLGRDGAFFPLETVDGRFGLGIEAAHGPWRGRIRFTHVSAHLADGDSTVTFPGRTYSREFVSLDAGFRPGPLYAYARIGIHWHAVPADSGIDLAVGAQWESAGTHRIFAAAHLSADTERAWRVNQSVMAGYATGSGRIFHAALRYYRGNRFQGQYWTRPESYVGLDLMVTP